MLLLAACSLELSSGWQAGAAARSVIAPTGAACALTMQFGKKKSIIPKGDVPETTGGDDKSWGLFAWAADTFGTKGDDPVERPVLGGKRPTGTDENGNFRGDRRGLENKKVVPKNINPLDPKTW